MVVFLIIITRFFQYKCKDSKGKKNKNCIGYLATEKNQQFIVTNNSR